jgi:hypothetical protein
MNPLRLNFRLREVRRPLSLARALTLNGKLVGTSRCDVPAREAAGGTIAPLNAARTAQRTVPTSAQVRLQDSTRKLFRGIATLFLPHHACLRASLGFLAALVFGLPPAQAAVTEAWVHRYSNVVSNVTDQAFQVVRDAAGDIIVTGTTAGGIIGQDMLTIKYSGADGSVLWQKRYNGLANGADVAQAVAVDGSGNVVVTGSPSALAVPTTTPRSMPQRMARCCGSNAVHPVAVQQ